MGRFVLVDDTDVPVSPTEAAGRVQERGFQAGAESYGVSVSTLRNFLKRNGYESRQTMTLVQVGVTDAAEGDAVTQG